MCLPTFCLIFGTSNFCGYSDLWLVNTKPFMLWGCPGSRLTTGGWLAVGCQFKVIRWSEGLKVRVEH